MKRLPDTSLRTSLVILLLVAMVVTLGTAGSVILAIRLPQIARTNLNTASFQALELATRVDVLLDGLESRVRMISRILPGAGRLSNPTVLDNFVAVGEALSVMYVIDPEGSVIATGVPEEKMIARVNIFSVEFSEDPLYRKALATGRPIWSDHYLSVLDRQPTIALAVPYGRMVVMAEIPLDYILKATRLSAGNPDLSVWVLNEIGEVIVDTEGAAAGRREVAELPVVRTAILGEALPETFTYLGKRYYPAAAGLPRTRWVFLAKMPAGLDSPGIRSTLTDLIALFAGSVVVSLLLAPWWAGRMIRPVRALIEQAHGVAAGTPPGDWPRGPIVEFNELSTDLERMARTLRERELKFLALFNDAPVAIMVSDPHQDYAIVEVNDAWIQLFGHVREEVAGKTEQQIGLWPTEVSTDMVGQSCASLDRRCEMRLRHRDGKDIICLINARRIGPADHPLVITVMEDVTERRRMEGELRALTVELEERVKQRTQALGQANEEITHTLDNLRLAQTELVRAEKLAALGGLVAGVAHELNTPIGNGLLAASTLGDQARAFVQQIRQGMRRSDLEAFIHEVELAADIASRNLGRAADLVTSFKQVAVDQTSSQRRDFNLKAVVDEILLTLRPTFKHTPYLVDADIPPDLQLDSYPGPLGQALTNLISNALLHGFEARDHGTVKIRATQSEPGWVSITVADDGRGIAPELHDKLFTPFFTTRMGRGGTGLGLHIARNAVGYVLGGSISLESVPDRGTTFTIRIPLKAPPLNRPEAV